MADNRVTGQAGRRVVSTAIRQALSSGDMVPGQRLVEQELSDTLSVTRSSVREALQDLAAEGLVELVPRRGARVRVISVEEAIQITECRAVLEGLCARRAAELASAEERAELAGIGDRMRASVAQGDLSSYSVLNRQLHAAIAEMSGQKVADGLLERLKGQMVRYQFRLALRPGRPSQSLPQHLAIIEAIVLGDAPAAEAAIRVHLDSVIRELEATPGGGAPDAHEDELEGAGT
ncbi:GntR family transcriptional regulator [Streptomyces sulfonofaciens]|uniref:GntR family transcriptional regulator n=1 Tax=Streptomyces sulfonofaciens TaxID=68272 RepID=A0A919KXZ8_9ACTN|nr:GntR family transcriptional regulator [Streptomyces sulfonofaciens]GHH76828.1 GntR family transcriptional regulator [Streptomyces sulfonofaciens]